MQLNPKALGSVTRALGLLTANLFAATAVHAQDAGAATTYDSPTEATGSTSANDDTAADVGLSRVDSSVLFYQEAGGRVKATEPVVSVNLNSSDGDVLSLKLTSDTLTGATPNGAAPWKQSQTFITPARAPGSSATVTGASGGSTIVTIPGVGVVARQYVTAPNQLPVDIGFRDQRFAIDAGYSTLWNVDTRISGDAGFSHERDYTSYTLGAGLARDLNQKNTTASLGLNLEFDQSRPFFGTPRPLSVMSADPKGSNQTKAVASLVLGVTQVITRRWLAQLNYTVGTTDGYQTDPYRIISMVDPATGAPLQYLYESRPRSRLRQSIYFANKIELGPTYADISARYYHDSWGISSVTVAASERIPITSWLYVEPEARYYSQSAARFFHNYLAGGQPLPEFASSDSRLGSFNAVTYGVRFGAKVGHTGEFYVLAEDYKQSSNSHRLPAGTPLAAQNMFTGVSATSVMAGYSFAFY
jgi:hypothetical protein